MSRKRYSPEQIIAKLREAEVALSQGMTVGQISRRLGIAEQTYYRWRKEYGGLKVSQAKRLNVSSGSGVRRGLKYPKDNPNVADCGSMTVPVFG